MKWWRQWWCRRVNCWGMDGALQELMVTLGDGNSCHLNTWGWIVRQDKDSPLMRWTFYSGKCVLTGRKTLAKFQPQAHEHGPTSAFLCPVTEICDQHSPWAAAVCILASFVLRKKPTRVWTGSADRTAEIGRNENMLANTDWLSNRSWLKCNGNE